MGAKSSPLLLGMEEMKATHIFTKTGLKTSKKELKQRYTRVPKYMYALWDCGGVTMKE